MGTSGDDEYFRLILISNAEVIGHPEAQKLQPAVARSFGKPEKVGFARAFLKSVRDVEVTSPAGLILGTAKAYAVDRDRLQRIMGKIIRGLFWHSFDQRLPNSYGVLAVCVNSMRQKVQKAELTAWVDWIRGLLIGSTEKSIGQSILIYRFNRDPSGSFRSVWGLTFFGRVHFVAFTWPRTTIDKLL